jgi:hypothetical protein
MADLWKNVQLSRALRDFIDNGHIYYHDYGWGVDGPASIDDLSNMAQRAHQEKPNSKTSQELSRLYHAAMEESKGGAYDRRLVGVNITSDDLELTAASRRDLLGDINKEFLIIEYPAINKKLALPGTLIAFEDRFKPSFHKEQVYGRMDPIVSYQNTSRTMTFSWEIDFSTGDSEWSYAALNDLAKMMYPVYQDACKNRLGTGTLVAAPLLKFSLRSGTGGAVKLLRAQQGTSGQTINGLLGVVDSFDYVRMDAKKGNFTMMRTPGAGLGNNILPAMLTINFGITVLHEGSKVGWVWEGKTEKNNVETLVFGQGSGYPYGIGSTLEKPPSATLAELRQAEDAAAAARKASDTANRDNARAVQTGLSGDPCQE